MSNLKIVKLHTVDDSDKAHVQILLKEAREWAASNNAVEAIIILRNKDGEVHTCDCMDDVYRGIGLIETYKAEVILSLIESDEDE